MFKNTSKLFKIVQNLVKNFLAATSSSRSDDVTPLACLFACVSPYFLAVQFAANLHLCNIMQYVCNVHSVKCILQCAVHSEMCKVQCAWCNVHSAMRKVQCV